MASIKKAPDAKVTGLGAPTRGTGANSYTLVAKWNVPSNATNSSNERRFEGYDVYWDFDCYNINSGATKTLHYQKRSAGASQREWTLYLNSFTCTDGKTYDRNSTNNGHKSFYPVEGYWCIRSVTVKVRGYNSKGAGPWATATRPFLKPNQPKITKLEQGENTGIVTVTVEHDKGLDFHEIHSTRIITKVWDGAAGKYLPATGTDTTLSNSNSSTTIQIEDIYSRMAQSYDAWIRVDAQAFARGLWGRSDNGKSANTVSKSLYISWPQQPVITYTKVASRTDVTAKITFGLETGYHPAEEAKTGQHNPHPTTGVKLERLVNVTYKTAQDIPGDVDWTECGAVDNGVCTALSSTVAELQPEVGKITWVRVKSWNQVEDIFFRYSEPRRMKELEREAPTAVGDSVVITSAIPGDDGTSAVVTLAWPTDDSTGTEVAWSKSPNAWRSTDEPDTYRVTWDDGPVTVGQTSYAHSAVLHIAGLATGEATHIRARRYHIDDDGVETFGDWYPSDSTMVVTPVTAPSAVTLDAQAYVSRGSDISCSWTFDGDAAQTSWELITGDTYTTDDSVPRDNNGTITYVNVKQTWIRELPYQSEQTTIYPSVVVLARGDDSTGAYSLEWDEHLEGIIGDDDELPLAVRIATGGDYVTSEATVVHVADRPTVSSLTAATVTAQPMAVTVTCDVAAALSVVVKSQYITGDSASGGMTQTEGDCVWAVYDVPTWTYSDLTELYTATFTAPTGLELIDGGTYTVTVRATDTATGLSSDEVTTDLLVNYSHKAPVPSATVTPFDTTDEGVRARGAIIELASPTGAASGDTYDVYRMTPDGPQLCAAGLNLTDVVTDSFAPFGTYASLAYRVCCKTVDGCEEWLDFPYQLAGRDLRIDFGDTYVELPYDVKQTDSYAKDFEARQHLDGSVDGYWNRGVTRTAGLSSNIIKVREESQAVLVRELARYSGPCYVRTSDGCAYAANVQVNDFGREANSFAISVSLNATEVGLTQEFMATVAPEEEE